MSVQRIGFFVTFSFLCQTSWAMHPPLTAAPLQKFARWGLATSDSTPASCSALSSIYSSCEAATPGFATLDLTSSQPLCLCYSSSTLAPSIYDNAFLSCVSYYETADPAVLTSDGIEFYLTHTYLGRHWTTPCAEYAAYQSVVAISGSFAVCDSWGAIVSSCAKSTPEFTLLALSSQASCACYLDGGSTYAPQVYDGYLDACLDYYSLHDSQYYSQLNGDQILRTPCVVAGNVKNGVTATGAQASAITSPSTQMSPTATEALTTSQARATAAPNLAARSRGGYSDWLMWLSLFALPLNF